MTKTRKIFGDVDLSNVDKRNVRLACVVRSPFRFFIGSSLHTKLTHADHQFEIYLRNEVVIATGDPLPNYAWGRYPLPDDLKTNFVIIDRAPQLSNEEVMNITKKVGWSYPDFFEFSPHYWRVFNVYRNLILALDTVVQHYDRSPGAYQAIHAPSAEEFQSLDTAIVFILCPRDFSLREEHFQELLTWFDHSPRFSLSFSLEEEEIRHRFAATPLSPERIQELERRYELQERYVHYEFAHQAEVELQHQDYVAALIAAVVALESAHSAYVRTQIEACLPSDKKKKERDQLVSDLLREQGISSLIQVTPYLFLPAEAQPSPEDIKECCNGLTMRNKIVHAAVKNGQPVIRNYDSKMYLKAIGSVLRVYKTFARELERVRDLNLADHPYSKSMTASSILPEPTP